MQIRPVANPTTIRPVQTTDRLETAFLAEMLGHAMPKPLSGPFGGGAGESHFASFRTEQLARSLAASIDLGLGRHLDGRDA